MALFGSPTALIGLDIGTSSLKLVELIDRKKRLELSTYAHADMPNMLVDLKGNEEDAIRRTANAISQMMNQAQTASDTIIAALPSSAVFSTVLTLPDMPEPEIDRAVQFAARDIVPASLDDMVLGWSRVGQEPHLATEQLTPPPTTEETKTPLAAHTQSPTSVLPATTSLNPFFITAAPKEIVDRYTKVASLLKLHLQALEVETFALARSLLNTPTDSALIVDLGDRVTTFHLIDQGTARVSHSIEYGGSNVTQAIAQTSSLSVGEAEEQKVQFGLDAEGGTKMQHAVEESMEKIFAEAERVIEAYQQESNHYIKKTIVIGGGANMRNLTTRWTQRVGYSVTIGDPWKGLTYPEALTLALRTVGSQYAVAVGLALRGFHPVA